jgi:hypothetical protein
MKRILSLAVSIIVVSLMTTATHAQTDNLKLRFHVPFPFTVENATFAAGEYEITQPARLVLELRNLQSQAAAFEHVESAHSQKEANGRMRLIFHRYGSEYFLAAVSDGSWQSTYDLRPSKEEKHLADASPMPHLKVVSVLANGTVPVADVGGK